MLALLDFTGPYVLGLVRFTTHVSAFLAIQKSALKVSSHSEYSILTIEGQYLLMIEQECHTPQLVLKLLFRYSNSCMAMTKLSLAEEYGKNKHGRKWYWMIVQSATKNYFTNIHSFIPNFYPITWIMNNYSVASYDIIFKISRINNRYFSSSNHQTIFLS